MRETTFKTLEAVSSYEIAADELTLKEIGEVLELSESRVCQIHSRVLLRLKGILGPSKESLWPN